MRLGNVAAEPVALTVAMLSYSEQEAEIQVGVSATGHHNSLPLKTTLAVLDEWEQQIMKDRAKENEGAVLLSFKGKPGEQFKVRVSLGSQSITEAFVI